MYQVYVIYEREATMERGHPARIERAAFESVQHGPHLAGIGSELRLRA